MKIKKIIPVTVLVGFLGSGKTTLLNNILSQKHGLKIACIVNDFSELNIDATLVKQSEDKLIQMSNGCICCTLREDLLNGLRDLSKREDIDYIVVESTGIGEPMPIAQTFYMQDLPDLVRLDTIVTVLDSNSFWNQYQRVDMIEDDTGNIVESQLANLLIDQIEFSNVLVLNKIDIANPKDVDSLESFVKNLNPNAKIIRTSNAQLDYREILDTNLYDYEKGIMAPKWQDEWTKSSSETEEYGFNNIIFRSDKVYSKRKFTNMLNNWPDNVLRAKGIITFENYEAAFLSFAGTQITLEEVKINRKVKNFVTEIVFIGIKVTNESINSLMQSIEI